MTTRLPKAPSAPMQERIAVRMAEQAFAELRLSNDPASASRWLAAQLAPMPEALA